MPKQSRPDDEKPGTLDAPNDASRKEQAEGSRDHVNAPAADNKSGGGITNRPLAEEENEQEQLPPRGKAKDGSHA
jgi:hypothetical protein